ncbi:MAG: ribosome maturation factor RimM [Chromatiaceae bacterium]|nr:MAG: ribosome maturation factor RimM [Chromatiaceae bacterium]
MGSDPIVVGRISGVHGVRGWVKLFSETDPRDRILQYEPLLMERNGQWQAVPLEDGRPQGKGVVAKFAGMDDRDVAATYVGCQLAIRPEQLEPLPEGEYYWADLIGLEVETLDGISLGRVENLIQTGANDVLVVRGDRERLIPYLREQVIHEIDLDAGRMRVDWDPDF